MLDISLSKIVRVIALAREYGSDGVSTRRYISDLNEDEQASLVALMWVGRDSFDADDIEEAKRMAQAEKTSPTEDYLGGEPQLADLLEDGLDALDINVADAEDHLRERP
ncbi:DUF3775 domain-containing protein [Vannielia litorea]|uniref:DUF3775 domain-containing protein n=1 Tax=Vannielia litorea TaxID=1217970 RepID=UPI001BCAB179|nr:DUF3775 domain-containing protein [Vannielia litorea]MBS8227782.1 DUF3775 domain-containing protein [Vannielia litorea]